MNFLIYLFIASSLVVTGDSWPRYGRPHPLYSGRQQSGGNVMASAVLLGLDMNEVQSLQASSGKDLGLSNMGLSDIVNHGFPMNARERKRAKQDITQSINTLTVFGVIDGPDEAGILGAQVAPKDPPDNNTKDKTAKAGKQKTKTKTKPRAKVNKWSNNAVSSVPVKISRPETVVGKINTGLVMEKSTHIKSGHSEANLNKNAEQTLPETPTLTLPNKVAKSVGNFKYTSDKAVKTRKQKIVKTKKHGGRFHGKVKHARPSHRNRPAGEVGEDVGSVSEAVDRRPGAVKWRAFGEEGRFTEAGVGDMADRRRGFGGRLSAHAKVKRWARSADRINSNSVRNYRSVEKKKLTRLSRSSVEGKTKDTKKVRKERSLAHKHKNPDGRR